MTEDVSPEEIQARDALREEGRTLGCAASAYALVCYADGRLQPSEELGFLRFVDTEPFFAEARPLARAAAWANALTLAQTGRAAGAIMREELAAAELSGPAKQAVIRAAQAAIVANEAVKPQEEAQVRAIAEALGLDPDTV